MMTTTKSRPPAVADDPATAIMDCLEAGMIAQNIIQPGEPFIFERVDESGPIIVSVRGGTKFTVSAYLEH